MKIFYILIYLTLPIVSVGQYSVNGQQEDYIELDSFNSIALETFGALYWEKEFELPFTFPYFDSYFNYIKCDVEGICQFEDDIDFSLRLLAFGYMYDNVLDPNNIESDVRYKFGMKEGENYLVLQFTKTDYFLTHQSKSMIVMSIFSIGSLMME